MWAASRPSSETSYQLLAEAVMNFSVAVFVPIAGLRRHLGLPLLSLGLLLRRLSGWDWLLPRDDYEDFEKTSIPSGLYGWRDRLYVLCRGPDSRGTTGAFAGVDPEAIGVSLSVRGVRT
jgi:hypothetical protein